MTRGKTNKKEVKKTGKRDQYNPDTWPTTMYNLALYRLTFEEIASTFNVSTSTLEKYVAKYPALRKAYEDGGRLADSSVARALWERATGYSHPETKFIKVKETYIDANGHQHINEKVEQHEYIKNYPPDTAAIIFFLQNRSNKNEIPWMNTAHHEVDLRNQGKISEDIENLDLSNFTNAELKLLQSINKKLPKDRKDNA